MEIGAKRDDEWWLMAKKSRRRATRRDRRKAKQSKWRRAGRSKGGVVAHGGSGETQNMKRSTRKPMKVRKGPEPSGAPGMGAVTLRVSIADICAGCDET